MPLKQVVGARRLVTLLSRAIAHDTAVDEALAALERNANAKVVANWLVLQL